jgi:putative phosphoribosyl transferase
MQMSVQLRDRKQAGRLLARELAAYKDRPDVIVLALPRGGVAVAHEIAQALRAPLDVFLVRKLGVPTFPELALGAITLESEPLIAPSMLEEFNLSAGDLQPIIYAERQELERRARIYRQSLPPLDVRGRTVILVDDGIATGSTMRAAITALRRMHPAHIIAAVGVAPLSTYMILRAEVDEVACLMTPREFRAVGQFYAEFPQLTDAEVCALLANARDEAATAKALAAN